MDKEIFDKHSVNLLSYSSVILFHFYLYPFQSFDDHITDIGRVILIQAINRFPNLSMGMSSATLKFSSTPLNFSPNIEQHYYHEKEIKS